MKKSIAVLVITVLTMFSCHKVDQQVILPEKAQVKVPAPKGFEPNQVVVNFVDGKEDKAVIASVKGSLKEKFHTKAMERSGANPLYVLNVSNVDSAVATLSKNPKVKHAFPNYTMSIPEGKLDIGPFNTINLNNSLLTKTKKSTGGPVFTVPKDHNSTFSLMKLEGGVMIGKSKAVLPYVPKLLDNSAISREVAASTAKSLQAASYPNDSIYVSGAQWGANNIHGETAWATNKGSQQVYVVLIDEGIYYWHPDLCGQIWNNPFEIPDNGIDDDGNGYIDDVHGWDFYNGDNTIFDMSDTHGTHTAGTIGANTNNTIGVAGICPNVTIISAKFLQGSGGLVQAIGAMDYATDLKYRHNLNIACTSNSWGYEGPFVQELYDAVNRERAANILFVAAAGNAAANSDIRTFYPADLTTQLDNVLSVGALNSGDGIASFSNYGLTTVDIFAPGQGIWSTNYDGNANPIYANFSGTSMATPHVAGAVALYKAGHPNATYQETRAAIINNGRHLTVLDGKCTSGKTLDVATFTQGSSDVPVVRECSHPAVDVTPPTTVTNVHVTGVTTSSVSFAWDPSSDPESGVYYYGIVIKQAGLPDATYSTFSTSVSFVDMPPGHDVTIIVYAINHFNLLSAPSAPSTGTTLGTPDTQPPTVPQNYRVIGMNPSGANWNVTLAWDAPTDNDKVLGTHGEGIMVGGNWFFGFNAYRDASGNLVTSIVIPGMPADQTFKTVIQAVDRSGNKSAFSDTLTFVTNGGTPPPIEHAPTTPTGLNVSGITTTSMTLGWSASSDQDGNLAGYTVFINGDSVTNVSSTSYNLTGLTPSTTYNLGVSAHDALGNYSSTATTQGTTLSNPNPQPVSVVLTGNPGRILTWAISNASNPTSSLWRMNSNGKGGWTQVTVSPSATNYTIPSKPAKTYIWQVRVADANGSAISNNVTL